MKARAADRSPSPRRLATRHRPRRVPRGDEAFWDEPSIAVLAAVQGVSLALSLDRVAGALRDLWASDADCEAFVRGIARRRRDASRR